MVPHVTWQVPFAQTLLKTMHKERAYLYGSEVGFYGLNGLGASTQTDAKGSIQTDAKQSIIH